MQILPLNRHLPVLRQIAECKPLEILFYNKSRNLFSNLIDRYKISIIERNAAGRKADHTTQGYD
jgi:hypothetical protein